MAGQLDDQSEIGGHRHYLDGQPVHCGDILELKRNDGSWKRGRYEWNWRREEPPSFFVGEREIVVLAPPDILRWPRP